MSRGWMSHTRASATHVLGGQALDDTLEDLVGGDCFANS